jgi:hypothetical protein
VKPESYQEVTIPAKSTFVTLGGKCRINEQRGEELDEEISESSGFELEMQNDDSTTRC